MPQICCLKFYVCCVCTQTFYSVPDFFFKTEVQCNIAACYELCSLQKLIVSLETFFLIIIATSVPQSLSLLFLKYNLQDFCITDHSVRPWTEFVPPDVTYSQRAALPRSWESFFVNYCSRLPHCKIKLIYCRTMCILLSQLLRMEIGLMQFVFITLSQKLFSCVFKLPSVLSEECFVLFWILMPGCPIYQIFLSLVSWMICVCI